MFWQGGGPKVEGNYVSVYHIRGKILGRDPGHMWGEDHPFGWDKLGEAISWLDEKFREQDWFWTKEKQEKQAAGEDTGTLITQTKEKYGGLRIYGYVKERDQEKYLDILEELIKEFPGVEDYITCSNGIPSVYLFQGTREECEKFCDEHREDTDEQLMAMVIDELKEETDDKTNVVAEE